MSNLTENSQNRSRQSAGSCSDDVCRNDRPLRLKLRVTLLEDLHSGTGTGSGDLDAVQATDREGYPVIRATHFKGVLKAAADELLELHCASPDQVQRLFGGGKRKNKGQFVMTSLYVSQEFRQPGKRADLRLVWSSTARDKEELNRTPLDDTLRSVEFIKAGTVFTGSCTLYAPDLEPLFRRCVKRTDRLGSTRTRGAGLVKINIEPDEPLATGTSRPDLPRKGIRLILRNLDPLCLPVTGNPGNIIPTECYIRGQALFGALAAYGFSHGKESSANRLFDRTISVGNAYPLPERAEEVGKDEQIQDWDVCPIPLDIMKPKPGSSDPNMPWWASPMKSEQILGTSSEQSHFNRQENVKEKLKRPGDTELLFRKCGDEPWTRYSPVMGVHLRNRVPLRHDAHDDGELFSEMELAENTLFLADVLFEDESTATWFGETFASILDRKDWLTLGRGSRPVEVEKWCWIDLSVESGPKTDHKTFSLTLESDLIARSPGLAFYDSLNERVLQELTGIGGLEVKKAVCETVEVRGFNAASGLPRAPVLAIRRGSVFRIEVEDVQGVKEKLAQRNGLGERLWEGFGRFRLDFDPLQESRDLVALKRPEEGKGVGLFNLRIEESILKASHERAEQISAQGPDKIPSRSQWQYMRQIAQVASVSADHEGRKLLDELIPNLRRHSGTKGGAKWENAHLGKIEEHMRGFLDKPLEEAHSSHVKNSSNNSGLMQACFFLTTLVRWISPKLKGGEPR